MKRLFEMLKSRRSDTAPSILNWLDDLDRLDDLSALEKTVHFLSAFPDDSFTSDNKRLETLFIIDEQNRLRMTKVTTQYTRCDNLRPELEAKISDLAYNFHRQIYLNYFSLIEKFVFSPDQHVFDYEHLQVLLGRTIDSAASMIKWRYFKQMPAPANVWLELFTLYKIAIEENLLDEPVTLFTDEASITLSALLAQVFMLGSLIQANMNCPHIQVTTQLLKLWMPTAQLYKNLDEEEFLFYIDMEKDFGAKRIRNFVPSPGCRYLDIQYFNLLVADAITALELNQQPEHLRLEEFTNRKVLLDSLRILQAEWSKSGYKRQRRREDRNKITKSVTLCYGMDEVCKQAHHIAAFNLTRGASIEGKSLDERIASHSVVRGAPNVFFTGSSGDSWLIVDESPKGLGMRVGKESIIQAAQGKLVGVVSKNQKNQLVVGIIKAIKPLPNDQYHIGVEILSRSPVWCQLSHTKKSSFSLNSAPLNSSNPATDGLATFSGLYLASEDGLSDHCSLLLPRMEVAQYGSYQVNVLGTRNLITLTEMIDGQGDWVQVTTAALISSS